jgi:hypothetical protein
VLSQAEEAASHRYVSSPSAHLINETQPSNDLPKLHNK